MQFCAYLLVVFLGMGALYPQSASAGLVPRESVVSLQTLLLPGGASNVLPWNRSNGTVVNRCWPTESCAMVKVQFSCSSLESLGKTICVSLVKRKTCESLRDRSGRAIPWRSTGTAYGRPMIRASAAVASSALVFNPWVWLSNALARRVAAADFWSAMSALVSAAETTSDSWERIAASEFETSTSNTVSLAMPPTTMNRPRQYPHIDFAGGV